MKSTTTASGHDSYRAIASAAAVMVVTIAGMALLPTAAYAQRDETRRVGSVPRESAVQAAAVWNAPGTRRVRGDLTLSVGDTVRSDLAVLDGRLRLGGVVTGQVVVLNGDALLDAGSRIDGDLTVIGGAFESPDRPPVGGEIRVWSAAFRYREDGDTLVAEADFLSRWSRWSREDTASGRRAQLFLTTAHSYNRVEGLPIYFGPRLSARNGDTRARAEIFGIFRTGDALVRKRENLGHRVLVEVRKGRGAGVAVGGRLFDEVDAVEQWQLTKTEVGLGSFVFTRDYRDYWQRHGAQGYLSLFAGHGTELRAGYGEERWSARRARDVWSLFNSDDPWRINPSSDEGVVRLATLTGTLDTRNSAADPRSGWLLTGEVERGEGSLASLVGSLADRVPRDITYSRALFDLRRYNRLGPGAQLNLRAVFGGWLSGDALPLQRRLAVSGIDALPGFDFRRLIGATDRGTCFSGSDAEYVALGRPALCDRIALLQAEWKGDFRINLFGGNEDLGDRRWFLNRMKADGQWVVFANSGRGWLVGPREGDIRYPRSRLPALQSWRTDLGGGFDFGGFGVYIAQAVSESGLSPNAYVRLGRRF